MESYPAHHRTGEIGGGPSRADPVELGVAELVGDVDVVVGGGEVGDAPRAGQVYRGLARRRVEYLGHENRRLALRDDLRGGHSRYKDRGPPVVRGPVESQTCMDSATANCSRRSPGAELERAGSLLGRVMFPEGSLNLCRLVVFHNATVRVSNSGYIMLQYSLVIQKPKTV
jgi:hypothetical protein